MTFNSGPGLLPSPMESKCMPSVLTKVNTETGPVSDLSIIIPLGTVTTSSRAP